HRDRKRVHGATVGSGLPEGSLKEVYEKLEPISVKEPTLSDVPREIGEVTWVKPELVSVVKFNAWTDDHRLRAPVFQGLRLDASPQDTVLESEAQPGAQPEAAPQADAVDPRPESPL